MASIHKRKGKYNLIYSYKDRYGETHQTWETFNTYSEAVKRKKKVEYEKSTGKQVGVGLITLNEVLDDYLHVYGEHKWAPSTYNSNKCLIDLYIRPFLGEMRMDKITVKTIEDYYISLLQYKKERSPEHSRQRNGYVTPSTILHVHKVLRCVFNQAIKWGYVYENPCRLAERPKWKAEKREIWDAETIFKAIDSCEDDILKLAINIAFACSLRMGEMLALTWDCVKIDSKSIKNGTASIFINKEIRRVSTESLDKVGMGDIIKVFPSYINTAKSTKLVLKTPKTESSVRTVYLPASVANMLVKRFNDIIKSRKILGDEYIDHNLVFCYPNGIPMEESYIRRRFNKLIEDKGLPKVVFHSLRHSSITYKLKMTGGDIKAVQGDSGHSQVDMITEVYAHILDESRIKNAEIFEEQFYADRKVEEKPIEKAEVSSIDITKSMTEEELIVKKLSENPEAIKLMKQLLDKTGAKEETKVE